MPILRLLAFGWLSAIRLSTIRVDAHTHTHSQSQSLTHTQHTITYRNAQFTRRRSLEAAELELQSESTPWTRRHAVINFYYDCFQFSCISKQDTMIFLALNLCAVDISDSGRISPKDNFIATNQIDYLYDKLYII